MPKTIYRNEYRVLLQLIRKHRIAAGLTQVQASKKLGTTQSFISNVERGGRRVDLIQLRDLCRIVKIDLPMFVKEFERELRKRRPAKHS